MSAPVSDVAAPLLTVTVIFALGWLWLVWAVLRERLRRRRLIQTIASRRPLDITRQGCCPHCRAQLGESGGSGSTDRFANYASTEELRALR